MQEDLYGSPDNGIHDIEISPRNNYGQVEKVDVLIEVEKDNSYYEIY